MSRHAAVLVAATLALQPPPFHTGVEVVTVDVSVTRADAPVAGLTADDFVVTDNGVRQRIDRGAGAESARRDRRPAQEILKHGFGAAAWLPDA